MGKSWFFGRERVDASESGKVSEERVLLTITWGDVRTLGIGFMVGTLLGVLMVVLLLLALPFLTSPVR